MLQCSGSGANAAQRGSAGRRRLDARRREAGAQRGVDQGLVTLAALLGKRAELFEHLIVEVDRDACLALDRARGTGGGFSKIVVGNHHVPLVGSQLP